MYLTSPANFGEPEPSDVRPGQTLPYREAVEQTEHKLFDEYTRACAGVRVLQMLRREAMSPAESVRFWEKVIDWLPKIFELKHKLEEKVRAHEMSAEDAAANLASQMRHVFPPGYALRNLESELAAARCALSKARWQFMAWQRTGRIPGERRLLHGLRGYNDGPFAFGFGGQAQTAMRCTNPLDDKAKAIIAAAQDPSRGIFDRAVQAVWSILRTYYPTEAAKVAAVIYSDSLSSGLQTTRSGAGSTATGTITVSRDFIDHTTEEFFARRVLQVGHELRHIDQYRSGMIGPENKAKREFLAHSWTAFAPDPPGTGCVSRATRVAIIDCALAFCHCISITERAPYAEHERRLLELRSKLQPRSPWPPAAGMPSCPPPGC